MPPSKMLKNIEAIGQERKSEAVIRQMHDAIARGEILPGGRLPSEPMLAESFAVSRTVIREAVRALETSGYLDVRRGSGGGTFVAERVPDEFRPSQHRNVSLPAVDDRLLLEVRLGLELAVMQKASCRTPRDLSDLRKSLLRSANFSATPARISNALTDFHVTLSLLSGNALLSHLVGQLVQPIRACISPRVRDRRWVAECHQQHEALARSVEDGDIEHAVALMKSHLAFEHGLA